MGILLSDHHNGIMRKLSSPLARIALAGVLVTGLLVLGVFLAVRGIVWAAEFSTVGAFFLGVAALLGPFIGRSLNEVRKPGPMSVEDEAAALRGLIRGELARSDGRLKSVSNRELQVGWEVTARTESATAEHQLGSTRQLGVGSEDFCRMFSKLSPKRVVIHGNVGAGKTIFVTQVARELLQHAAELLERRDPRKIGTLIPFYILVTAWDPDKDLVTWIADQLIRTDPRLGIEVAAGTGNRVADDWVKHKVLPIIDGLDELPLRLRAKAVADVNEMGKLPVVLTTRPQEYADALAAIGRPISDSIVLDLCPLGICDAKNYLVNTTSVIPEQRWKEVFERLANETEDPLKQVLTNPLMLWLASRVYEATESFPGELADDRLGDQEAIEDHLLDAFIPAVYSRRTGSPRPHWTPAQARRWLAFLAHHTTRTRSPDIAWWRLASAVRWLRPAGAAIRAVLLFAVAWWLAVWALRLRPDLRHGFGFQALLRDGILGRQIIPFVRYLQDLTRIYLPNEVKASRAAIGSIPWHSLAALEVWVALLAVGAGTWSALRDRYPATLRTVRIRSLKSLVGVGISLGGTAIFAGLLWLGIVALSHVDYRRNGHIVMSRTVFPLHSAQILLLAMILWMLNAVPAQFIHRIEPPELVSPRGSLQRDRHATFFAMLSKFFSALLAWLLLGMLIAAMYAAYVAIAFICRLLLGGIATASDRFTDARVWLACSRRMPWRVMAFLADASDRGVLRQSGAVYQFRHIRLRQQLSTQHARLSRSLTSVALQTIRSTAPMRELARTWSPKSTAPWSEPFWALRFKEFASKPTLRQCLPTARPAGQILNAGPGYAQAFTTTDGESWMICARPSREPVMVAASVWRGLRNAASQAMRDAACTGPANLLTAVGFPVSGIINENATRVVLKGGSWGDGLLARPDERSSWRWEPFLSFEPYSGRLDSWEKYGSQLSVSVDVHFFWDLAHLTIKPETYQARPDQLAICSLPQAVTDLWTRRGAGMPKAKWRWSELSGKHKASLLWEVTAPDKTPVMTGSFDLFVVRLAKIRPRAVIWSKVQLCVENVAAWRDYLQAASGSPLDDFQLRLSLDELNSYLSASWHIAAETLPTLVVEDPFSIYPTYPPLVELSLSTDSRCDEMSNCRDLRNRVDFMPFTRASDSQLTHMSVKITGPPQLNGSDRTKLIDKALTYMIRQAGFDVDQLPAGSRNRQSLPGSETRWRNAALSNYLPHSSRHMSEMPSRRPASRVKLSARAPVWKLCGVACQAGGAMRLQFVTVRLRRAGPGGEAECPISVCP